ncbi:efflux RND transporter permease subunit [Evansella halocellulosilytica]|uniref:efflux RND transporter permease subunit n=1 Tax=Evansella halocellulosilytica TaxID=2011013 RepID=UPI000BB90B7E|nr:efflux RND transporter permease subunit [Evansella halocellulosilytica]
MQLLKMLLKRKLLVGLMVVFVVMVGSYSIGKMGKELFPPITMDYTAVYIQAGEMAAIDVEERITIPVEQTISNVDGVESIESNTTIGNSVITLTLEEGRGDEVTKDVEASLAGLQSDIPEVDDYQVFAFSTDQPFEFYMDLSGGSLKEMSAFAREVVKPRLEGLGEVREVNLNGLMEKEYIINLDQEALQNNGLEVQQVIQSIEQANLEATVGELKGEDHEPLLRWNTSLTSIEDIEELKIPTMESIISLSEVSDVYEQESQESSFIWKDGSKDFIFIEIGRTNGYTQIDLAEAVRDEVQAIHDEGLVEGFQFNEVVAQADYVSDSIGGVSNNVIIGGILALVVLMLFLRNVRATFIVGLTIPISILLTFAVMWMLDYSFNMLSLIALGLGIGMMVDASIVILESIYRKKEQGLKGTEAVVRGVREVATAVIASMLTTVVVFLPVGLFGGEFGPFIIVLSVVVVITLVSSVVISFTLIPSLAENFLKLKEKKKAKKESKLINLYGKCIDWISTKKRRMFGFIALFIVIFGSSLALTTKVPMTVLPDMLNRYSEVVIQLENGVSAEEREEIIEAFYEKLDHVDDLESSIVMDDPEMIFALINMTKGEDISVEQDDVNEQIFAALRELEEEYPVSQTGGMATGPSQTPVQLKVKGENLDELKTIAEDFQTDLGNIEGVTNSTSSMAAAIEEQRIVLKEDEIEEDGLTASMLYQHLQGTFIDYPIGELNENGVPVKMIAKTQDAIENIDDVMSNEVQTMQGMESLSKYMSLEEGLSPNEILREDGERYATISGQIEGRDLGAVTRDIEQLIRDTDVPLGYSVSTGGDIAAQQEMIQDLLVVLGISIFLVYVVMAVQFNNLIHPFIVMSIIPMTAIGAIFALLITQRELSILSAMGLLMLIGIVLNNAILLIDRIKQLRLEGMSVKEAVVEAGKNRIRPIFMTTLTTIGGMLPLAIATGASGNYQAPLATVIIGGLLFATFITLILIPSLYVLLHRTGKGFKRLFKRKGEKEESDIAA